MKLGLGKWKKTRKGEEYTEKKGFFWVKWVTNFGEVEKAKTRVKRVDPKKPHGFGLVGFLSVGERKLWLE